MRFVTYLLVALVGVLALPIPAQADSCPTCRGSGEVHVRCARCSGTGIEEEVWVGGQLGWYGCEACGGARGNLDGTGRRGRGTVQTTCRTCGGTGDGPSSRAAREWYDRARRHAQRYNANRDRRDLDEAIEAARRAADLDPSHRLYAPYLRSLENSRQRLLDHERRIAEEARRAGEAQRLADARSELFRRARSVMTRLEDLQARFDAMARSAPPVDLPVDGVRVDHRISSDSRGREDTAPLVRIGAIGSVEGRVRLRAPGAASARDGVNGGDVFFGDVIETGLDGRMQVMLLDGTVFVIDPGSELYVDEFVYDPFTRLGRVLAKATQGVFRFVTGHLGQMDPKVRREMNVNLPAGHIGIRGTDFTVDLTDPDYHRIWVRDGQVEFTHRRTGKVWSIDAGETLRVGADGSTPSGVWPRALFDRKATLSEAAGSPWGRRLRVFLLGFALCAMALGGVFLLRAAPAAALGWALWAVATGLLALNFG